MEEINKPLKLTDYISNSMTVMAKPVVQIYILALLLVNTNSAKTPITCTAGDFPIGGNASVTCNFGPEIDLNKTDYAVKHYPFQGDNTQGKDVLNCHINKQCILERIKGMVVTYPPHEPSIVVVMFDATEEVEGTYLCQMLPPTGNETECNLTVHAYPPTPRFASTTVEPVDKGTANIGAIVPAAKVLCVGFIAFVITTIVCVWRHRHGQSVPGEQRTRQPSLRNNTNVHRIAQVPREDAVNNDGPPVEPESSRIAQVPREDAVNNDGPPVEPESSRHASMNDSASLQTKNDDSNTKHLHSGSSETDRLNPPYCRIGDTVEVNVPRWKGKFKTNVGKVLDRNDTANKLKVRFFMKRGNTYVDYKNMYDELWIDKHNVISVVRITVKVIPATK